MQQARRSFTELAKRLAERHPGHPLPAPSAGTVVVLPSLTFPLVELRKIIGIRHYEERLLFLVLLLAEPGRRMVYVSSAGIDPDVVDYYLGFLPDPAGARARLELVSLGDVNPEALAVKLTRREDVLSRLAELIGDPDDALMLAFNVTSAERAVAERLGVGLWGPPPELIPLGSKTGSRRVGRAAGVDVLDGSEDLWSMDEVERAVQRLRRTTPGTSAVVVKLNNGFSGQGNAIVELGDDSDGGHATWRTTFCAAEESWPSFAAKIAAEGGVVERLVRAAGVASPSAQVSIAPGGDVQVISTHDQVLGGPSNQVYLGCRYPADPAWAARIQRDARAVAEVLVARGVIGTFGIDFFALAGEDGDPATARVSLCEINLRMGGTTHPYWMVRLATGADWDAAAPGGGRIVVGGEGGARVPLCYAATDNLKSAGLIGHGPADVIAKVAARGLDLRPGRTSGVALHLLGALREHGKMGMTCVAGSPAEADELATEVRALLGA